MTTNATSLERLRPHRHAERMKLIFFLAMVTGCEILLHFAFDKKTDFGVFCYAARMIRDGQGGHLYDASAQLAYQLRFGRPVGLDFYYPAIVALFYLPFTYLPQWLAFGSWTALNLGLLSATVLRLNRHFRVAEGNWPVLIALASYPVAECIANGQVAILVFALLTLSFLAWKAGRDLFAGLILGCVAFKFQLLLGFGALALSNRYFRLLLGMLLGAIPIVAVSLWIVGWEGAKLYPSFVRSTAMHAGAELNPLAMANLRALLYLVLRRDPPAWTVVFLSVVTIVWAATRRLEREAWFCVAVAISVLVSFHLYPPELTFLLIPVGYLAMRDQRYLPWHLIILVGFFAVPVLLLATNLFPILSLGIFALARAISRSLNREEKAS